MSGSNFLGAVRSVLDDCDSWHMTYDARKLAEGDDDDVLFVSSLEELETALRERYPDEAEQFGRVLRTWDRVDVLPEAVFRAVDHSQQADRFSEREVALLQQLARSRKQVPFAGLWHNQYVREAVESDEFLLVGDRLVYSPVRARNKRQKRRLQTITRDEMFRHLGELRRGLLSAEAKQQRPELEAVGAAVANVDGGLTIAEAALHLRGRLLIFEKFFGVRAVRRCAALRELKREWARNPVENARKYGPELTAALARYGIPTPAVESA